MARTTPLFINPAAGNMGPDILDLDRYYSIILSDMNPAKLKPLEIKMGDQVFATKQGT